jgi:hypothetical protein
MRLPVLIALLTIAGSRGHAGGQGTLVLPPGAKAHVTTETKPAGTLTYEVLDIHTGTIVSSGSRTLKLSDFTVIEAPGQVESRLSLDADFYIGLAPSISNSPTTGFGLVGRSNKRETFCWEWFQKSGPHLAKKLQERGELEFDESNFAPGWQITRMKFLTDISIRVQPKPSVLSLVTKSILWRINIKAGSEIKWPALVHGAVVSADDITSASVH